MFLSKAAQSEESEEKRLPHEKHLVRGDLLSADSLLVFGMRVGLAVSLADFLRLSVEL